MGEDSTEDHNIGKGGDRLTIAEAATLLGVHKNTVRNRIKDGTYKAEKVITERGQTYLIERKSLLTNLTTNTLSSDSQQLVSPAPMEFVQELLRPFVNELGEVREELGAERARRQMAETTLREGMAEQRRRREQAEQERDKLRWELEAIRAGLESPERRKAAPVRAVQQPHPDVAGSQTAAQGPQRKTLRDWTRSLFGR